MLPGTAFQNPGGIGTGLPPAPAAPFSSWQNPSMDGPLRENITQNIIAVFLKKKGQIGQTAQQEMRDKLGGFVKRVEEHLYASARTREEYQDLNTLDHRLTAAARLLVNNRNVVNNPAASSTSMGSSGMIPNPQPPSGMIPNPQPPQLTPGQPPGQGHGMGMPSGMMPNPGGMPGMGGMNGGNNMNGMAGMMGLGGFRAPGSNNNMKHGGMPGFIPTPGTNNNMFGGQEMAMRSISANGSGALPPGLPGLDGTGPGANGLMPGFGNMGGMMGNGTGGLGPFGPVSQQGPMPGQNARTSVTGASGMIPVSNLGMNPLSMGSMSLDPMEAVAGMQGQHPNQSASQAGPSNGMATSSNQQAMPPIPGNGVLNPAQMTEQQQTQYVQKQQRWLLFLRHCAKCRSSETECQLQQQCKFGKQLWQHILHCSVSSCPYPRCSTSKELLKHHQKCSVPSCPICAPVKEYVRKTRAQQATQSGQMLPTGPGSVPLPLPPLNGLAPGPGGIAPPPPPIAQPPSGMVPNGMMMPTPNMPGGFPGGFMPPAPAPMPPAITGQKRPHSGAPYPGVPPAPMPPPPGRPGVPPGHQNQPGVTPSHEPEHKRQKVTEEDPKMMLAKNTYTSLLETFTVDQLRKHKELIYQAAAQARNAQMQPPNQCDLCTICYCTKLLFEPAVLYCSHCAIKIKRGQVYYATTNQPDKQDSMFKGSWCHTCFSTQEKLPIFGTDRCVNKQELLKRKNDEEVEEPWVQCDVCGAWVHQICGLFNKGRNDNTTHYLCPDCLIKGGEEGVRDRITQRPQSMLDSRDLPHCELSKFLEARIQTALEMERHERAAKENKQPFEVPTAEGITIRVVNNMIKKCEVRSEFYKTFKDEGYPSCFPYKQRVVLLFQNLDGVDVCLFCMYVQEYGEDCPMPNRNCVYLSYLDSVKYFRPEVTAVPPKGSNTYTHDIGLRTYVYHQVIVGYLSWIKAMGYEQMYIWACPPMQGDDYIMYCHPHRQKIPRSDRLRMWYLDMIKVAKQEGLTVHNTTLWDTYFPGGKEHRLEKCSAAHIPYLDGDYWPGEAENQLASISNISQGLVGKNGKGSGASARAAKMLGKRLGNSTPDEALLEKLGEVLGGNMKEDFIVVHLQEVCTFCRKHVHGGHNIYRYRSANGAPLKPPAERKFEGIKLEQGPNVPLAPVTSLNICEDCYSEECIRHAAGLKLRLPSNVAPTELTQERIERCPENMKDVDPEMENEFFETRQSFLSLCQGNHYQFDTLRRAKHSSMMVLYHLHNPTEPAFASTCNLCNTHMEAGTGWRCTVCTDFDICSTCKERHPHEHPLAQSRTYDETRMRMTDQERRERNATMARTMELLVHACTCNSPSCVSTSCKKVKALFAHAGSCQVKLHGNCTNCRKVWCLLTLHAKQCSKSNCPVPQCNEIKEMRRRQAARQEDMRRKGYANMVRNQYSGK